MTRRDALFDSLRRATERAAIARRNFEMIDTTMHAPTALWWALRRDLNQALENVEVAQQAIAAHLAKEKAA